VFGIIYKAENTLNGKVYIGQTIQSLFMRKKAHLFRAKKGDRRSAFQLALLEEGTENFQWKQIDTADSEEELNQKEKHWIAHYDSTNPEKGYNGTEGGIKTVYSLEARRNIGEAKKGQIPWNKDKHLSSETRKKISEAKRGEKHPLVKLTEAVARQIKTDIKAGMKICDIMRKHNVSYESIRAIKRGRTWAWLQVST